ncbi:MULTISPECIES: glycosyltransferase family 4 protein [Cellulosimicrobium]|nr:MULTISPECIES: glycosyltransferase family 4 protein [Cellulosimicrobium]
MRALRVSMVLPADEPYASASGAVSAVAHALTRHLLDRGAQVEVLSPRAGVPTHPAGEVRELWSAGNRPLARRAAARVRRALARENDAWAAYRREVVRRSTGDAVIVHNDARLARLVAVSGRPTVLWLHNLLAAQSGEDVRAFAAHGGTIVGVSEHVRAWTVREHRVPEGRTTVVHNALDHDVFRPPDRWQPGPSLRVVIHGRIDPNKGQVLAAEAVALARSRGAAVELSVAGAVKTFGMSPPDVEAYVARLDDALRAAGARRLGPVPAAQVPALLAGSDVGLALPTVPEPFSLAALECMASGCAVVAVPLGGLAEVVGDAALLCEPTTTDVADALCTLASDPDALARRRAAALARAGRFTWEDSAERTLAVLHDLLGR